MMILWSSPLAGFSTNGLEIDCPLAYRMSPFAERDTADGAGAPPPVPSSGPGKQTPVLFFTYWAWSADANLGPPSRLTSRRFGVGTLSWSNIIRHSRRSH